MKEVWAMSGEPPSRPTVSGGPLTVNAPLSFFRAAR